MPNLEDVAAFAATVGNLAVVSIARPDGTVQASLVNAGVGTHPVSGQRVLSFVAIGGSAKLALLRKRPSAAITFQRSFEWITVEGNAEIAGPDDTQLGLDAGRITALLRTIFADAGGTHDDWPTYDETMLRERRAGVLITPTRIYSNPGAG